MRVQTAVVLEAGALALGTVFVTLLVTRMTDSPLLFLVSPS